MSRQNYLQFSLIVFGLVAAGAAFAQTTVTATSWILSAPDVQQTDLAIIKRRLHLVRSADAYVAPLDRWFVRALDEDGLRAVACRSSTDDPSRLADLVTILDESDLQSSSFSPSGFETRELIYLRLSNGEAMKITLQQPTGGSRTISGTIDYKQISVSAQTVEKLYQWVGGSSTYSTCNSAHRKAGSV